MRLLIDRVAEHRGLTPPDWPAQPSPVPTAALADARDQLAGLDVTGAAYELLGCPPPAARRQHLLRPARADRGHRPVQRRPATP
ncbi:hypothetical protein [Amycolatopsis sp. YIM 10]|uniref:hypothetical protein n=1 Tax=Amycolatopsis sp. YIM 10 TaxID=2653857 RepID=UPI00129087F9|nr:hypothetical protein [Amycolatopsis sp. YIM 10]